MTLPSSRPLSTLLVIALCCNTVFGFNVDVKNCIRHRGPEGSMFGFSVAQHKEHGRSWLLIGAPEAQTAQPGVEKGGAVFKCGTTREDDCEQIPFDTRGNNNSSKWIQIDSKSRQWFGATVRSSGDNGVVLACAPRYVYFTSNGNKREPVGSCYTTSDFTTDFAEYSPCRTRNWGHHKQGTCQAGLGASVSKDGKRLFIGAVGSWYWQGQFYSQNLYSRPDVLSTNEGPPADDDSYLGYSVAVGAFGFGSESGAAVGMPRGAGLFGKVLLYSTDLINLYNITGDQLGAYFGYSICVSDVDGDGGDDIIIGAPLYSEFSKNDGSYETGKVYVYLKKEGYKFYERNTRMGLNSKSRFGLALSNLGDINKDGYGDFAVGAPYDGPNELGAVYIYHGTKTGVREKYSQVIKSEDVSVGARPISTFGFSLSGGTDLDNNQYPDLIIGAYESDIAYFMKSRPVAQMTTSVYFKSENKQIALERRECTTRDGTLVPCLFLSTCLQYTGIGVDDQLNIEMQLILDAKKPKSPRMFFLLDENRNVLNHSLTLDKNDQSCKTFNVYLKNNVRDKLTPLEAELRYRIIEENRKFTRTLTPVIDLDNELFAVSRDSISIQKNCGGDNICIPNLRLIATPDSESFLLGSNKKLKVDVIVQNEGEDSFETTFDMTVPPGINYVKIERVDNNENDIPVQCSAPSEMTNNTLHCDIGNPLPRDKYVQFKVVLEPYQTTETKAKYEFNMVVNSTNPERFDSVSDNTKYLGVPLWAETDLIIVGSSKPVDVHYNITMEESLNITDEKQIGPQVIHIYGIRNKGPSDILEAEAYIDWPMFTLAGEPLLYLLEMPETNGQVKCEAIEEINPLKLNIDRKRKSYFESSGLISSGSGASVTVKGSESTSSSSADAVVTKIKTFAELTEEEKKRFMEIQKKEEEESKLQWGDGSYEQKIRYQNSKHESSGTAVNGGGVSHSRNEGSGATVVTDVNRGPKFMIGSSESGGGGGVVHSEYSGSMSTSVVTGGQRGSEVSGTSVVTNANRGPAFTVESSESSGGVVHNEYESKSSSSGSAGGASSAQGNRWSVAGGAESDSRYGSSSRGVYGAAHFDESESSSGGSTFQMGASSSGGTSRVETVNTDSRFAGSFENSAGSDSRGQSSVTVIQSGSEVRGGSKVYGGSEARGGSEVYGGSEVRGEWSSGGQSSVNSHGGVNGWETSKTTAESRGEKWSRDNGVGTQWNQGNSGWHQGAKNFTSFRESEKSHVTNTTWDDSTGGGMPKTYVTDRWRTNNDGVMRNGSSSHVVDGDALDYRDAAVHRMNMAAGTSGVTNVLGGTTGDDSDLSISLTGGTAVTERQNQGFRQTKVDESETVQRWRTVDGKLYRANAAGTWDTLHMTSDGSGSTDVYEAQDLSPQNYVKPTDVDGKFKLYTRFRRDTQTKRCGPTRCVTVKCKIGPLSKDQEVWLSFRSRAWVSTLKKVALNRPVTLSSTLSAKVTKLQYIGKPESKLAQVRSYEVFTEVIPRDLAVKPDIIPLWIVVLAAVAGTAILLLLVYLLYKCGFFKRNRPSNAPEKQPLTHRNGQAELYQTGDEAL
ncbi:integrin alpha-PS2-like isoform X2 [Rhopalosiphum maidis]|uniref:integrin alpha-PS2-like isoform X2 n=1 Tax=Rhopalosiphum maidis TaxID=43146 RepID=UPI000F00737A|nr:integrin alpha-PS2-like isoform X2 [Rhopalosiphum maidis]